MEAESTRLKAAEGGHDWSAAGPVFVLGERIGGEPDEAYVKFTRELAARLSARVGTVLYSAGGEPTASLVVLPQSRALVSPSLWREVGRHRPSAIVYVSRSSATAAALARAKLLKVSGRGAVVAMVALQPRRIPWLARHLGGVIWPDLLLVTTETERREAERLGARVERVFTGVDLERVRPPQSGEKEALRRKWDVPAGARVVLHVGHLTEGRNLRALLPLARRPELKVMVVISGQRGRSSETDIEELRRNQVVVVGGYLPNIEEVYQLADCYVFPVASTDFAVAMPLSVLEALACGVPVASMRFGALGERFDGDPAVRFADDHEELVAAVLAQLESRHPTRHLVEPYSWDAIADRILAILGTQL
jgi:glycosyltransferase involved in cell wall biosynthesis